MKMNDEDRKYILNEYLRNISHISDIEYQRRVWIRGEGPEVNDFDEAVCHFFDDGDPIIDDYKEFGINEMQYALLINFREEFENFSKEHYSPQDFINTPEWRKITEMAKEVLKAFNYKKIRQ